MWFLDQVNGGRVAIVACHVGLFMTSSIKKLSKVYVRERERESVLLYLLYDICVFGTLEDGNRRHNA